MKPSATLKHMKVIFFDGYCGLCNGFVNFMMKRDHQAIFKFSPLQSEFAQKTLPPSDTQDLKSMVTIIDDKIYRRANGVITALSELGGGWKIVLFFKIFPESMLNFFYNLLAKFRYTLFGKTKACRLPTPEEKTRFIL